MPNGCTIKDCIFLISNEKASGCLFMTCKVLRTVPSPGQGFSEWRLFLLLLFSWLSSVSPLTAVPLCSLSQSQLFATASTKFLKVTLTAAQTFCPEQARVPSASLESECAQGPLDPIPNSSQDWPPGPQQFCSPFLTAQPRVLTTDEQT